MAVIELQRIDWSAQYLNVPPTVSTEVDVESIVAVEPYDPASVRGTRPWCVVIFNDGSKVDCEESHILLTRRIAYLLKGQGESSRLVKVAEAYDAIYEYLYGLWVDGELTAAPFDVARQCAKRVGAYVVRG